MGKKLFIPFKSIRDVCNGLTYTDGSAVSCQIENGTIVVYSWDLLGVASKNAILAKTVLSDLEEGEEI